MIGELSRLPRRDARRRAGELLAWFGLEEAARRPVRTYSGGMRRRLDLAASLLGRPSVLFLDEPTTGLDPASRRTLWDSIRELVRSGTTLLLTTQYLEEADYLADQVCVVDDGRVAAAGTPADLKARVGAAHLRLTVACRRAGAGGRGPGSPRHRAGPRSALTIWKHRWSPREGLVSDLVQALAGAGVRVDDLALRQPSLDDVFHALTGTRRPG